MITPEYLEQIMSQAQNTLNGASERIIQTLAERLETTITKYGKNDLIPTSLNEILNLEEVGMTYAEVQREVEKALPQIQEQVREAFVKGAQKMDEYYGGGVRDTYKGEGAGTSVAPQPKQEPKNPETPPLPEKSYKFPDFVSTTGYGNMLGLCGINCRHTFSIFFPNLMDSTPDKIDKKSNQKKYQAEQKARAMERQIRAKKQALSAFQAVSDEIGKAEKATLVQEINSLIRAYQNFCRENKISMTEWRLATYDSHAEYPAPANRAKAKANPQNMSSAMKKRLEEVYRRTNGDIYNICQTTAPSTQDTFITACDDAFMNIQAGMPLNEAISRAIYEVAEKGVSCVYYNSGRVDKMEVALARAIRTGINQANAQLVLMKCAELGIDYVKVSSHYGARVTKQNDYTNHSWWQGKVYKLNWNDKVLSQFKSTPNTENAQNEPKMAQEYANNAQGSAEDAQNINNAEQKTYVSVPILDEELISKREAENLIPEVAGNICEDVDIYDKWSVLYELRETEIGRVTIKRLYDSKWPITFMNNFSDDSRAECPPVDSVKKFINIYSNNNKSLRVQAESLIHETAHLYYKIEKTQIAEAICYCTELMHKENKLNLTKEEWKFCLNIAKKEYPELPQGDITKYERFFEMFRDDL